MKIYIDLDYKCHVSNNDGTVREVDVPFFDGKCAEYIEGYRFVPDGETWTREDGATFEGEMVAPWKPWDELDAAQRQYERQLLAEAQAALKILEVSE
ncbi:MAG: hypothetical protein J6J62_06495 [Oscillospiraceae bacterium]|nr:hypothetical protein [Oscillospiraceae bacterium]